jgi:hypothetical protein
MTLIVQALGILTQFFTLIVTGEGELSRTALLLPVMQQYYQFVSFWMVGTSMHSMFMLYRYQRFFRRPFWKQRTWYKYNINPNYRFVVFQFSLLYISRLLSNHPPAGKLLMLLIQALLTLGLWLGCYGSLKLIQYFGKKKMLL